MNNKQERKRRKPFIEWLYAAINKEDRSVQRTAERSGIHSSTFSRWFSGETEPDPKRIALLADYFGVERKFIYSLLGRAEPTEEEELTEDERSVLRLYRSLGKYDRITLQAMVEAFARAREQNETEPGER